MKQQEKQNIITAAEKHIQEKLQNKGWSKTAITLAMAILAALASYWLTSCGSTLLLDNPSYGTITITPAPSIQTTKK